MKLLLITGMHRSGTSCLAGCLEQAGVDLGTALLPAAQENALGFKENARVTFLNEDVLANSGHSWDAPPRGGAVWRREDLERRDFFLADHRNLGVVGIKDPRLIFTAENWLALPYETAIVATIRHPLRVVDSLVRRAGGKMSHAYALSLWTAYAQRLLELSERHPITIVDFDAPRRLYLSRIIQIASALGLEKTEKIDFRREGLRHGGDEGTALDDTAVSLHKRLIALANTDTLPIWQGPRSNRSTALPSNPQRMDRCGSDALDAAFFEHSHRRAGAAWDRLSPYLDDLSEWRGALCLASILAQRQGDRQSARVFARRAIEICDEAGVGHWLLACASVDHQPAEALRAAQAAAARLANPCMALAMVGRLQRAAGHMQAARDAFCAALDIDPGHDEAAYGLAALDTANGDYMAAKTVIDRALAERPRDPGLLLWGCRIYLDCGDVGAARNAFNAACKTGRSDPVLKKAIDAAHMSHEGTAGTRSIEEEI